MDRMADVNVYRAGWRLTSGRGSAGYWVRIRTMRGTIMIDAYKTFLGAVEMAIAFAAQIGLQDMPRA